MARGMMLYIFFLTEMRVIGRPNEWHQCRRKFIGCKFRQLLLLISVVNTNELCCQVQLGTAAYQHFRGINHVGDEAV